MKALALLRVSSEAQAGPERGGLPGQRRTAQQIAARHELEIVEEVEIRVSGARVLEEPAFQRLLIRIEDPAIAGVIVSDLDRLMRPEDPGYYSIFRRFRDTSTVLYTNAGIKDYRRDRLLMTLEAEIAALERERIAERTRRGREEKRRQGRRAEGGVGFPRAVHFDHTTGEWSYVWPEADKIRQVFALWLGSHGTLSYREIARRTELVPEGYPEPSSAIRRVLSQPLYAGIYRVDRRWKNGKPYPREAHERYEMRVLEPGLVSEQDFARAQELMAQRRAKRPPRRSQDAQGATYAGHLECGVCGASLWVVPDSKGYKGYCCGRRRDKHCPTGQTSVRLADPQIDAALEERLGNIDTLTALLRSSSEAVAAEAGPMPAEATRKLAQLHNQRERVKDAYEEGVYSLQDLEKRITRIDGEISTLQEMIERSSRSVSVAPRLVQELVDVFCDWSDLRRTRKREILQAYQIRITVTRRRRRVLSIENVLVGVVET